MNVLELKTEWVLGEYGWTIGLDRRIGEYGYAEVRVEDMWADGVIRFYLTKEDIARLINCLQQIE